MHGWSASRPPRWGWLGSGWAGLLSAGFRQAFGWISVGFLLWILDLDFGLISAGLIWIRLDFGFHSPGFWMDLVGFRLDLVGFGLILV